MPRARARGPEAAVRFQEHQLAEWQRASLPVPGPATRQVLRHSSQACAQRRLCHPHTTPSSGCRGDVDAHLCPSPLEGLCIPATKLSHAAAASALCCCASALWLPSAAPRGEQLSPHWQLPRQPQPAWPDRGVAHGQEHSPRQALVNGSQEAGLLLLIHKREILIPL